MFDECSDTTARRSPDQPPKEGERRSPSVVWSALRSGLRPSLRSAQTTDPTGHHSCRSTGHRSCRRARRELALEAAIAKLDKYHLLVLDDLAYVTKDQAETSVLFELISARYERRSTLITANQPFGEWNRVFPDPAMTLAAVDRLVHHATIFEMNVESYRRRSAIQRQSRAGRPPTFATIRSTEEMSRSDNQTCE